jgi:hypothetical protein
MSAWPKTTVVFFLIKTSLDNFDSTTKTACKFLYCGIRLREQNDKNLAIFGHFQKVRSSKRTKRGVKIVVRNKKL